MPEQVETVTLQSLQEKTLKEMYGFAKHYKIPYYGQMNKKELALAILRAQEEATGFFQVEGVLDINRAEGFGFLRPINYSSSQEDILYFFFANSPFRPSKWGPCEWDSTSATSR